MEADLLDARRFDEWLALLAEDVRIWAPIARNVASADVEREHTREGLDANWIDEGLETLAQRATQLRTGVHWAEQPPSRTTRMVSNVRVLAVKRRGGGHKASLDDVVEIRTRCRFMLYRNRNEDEQDFFVGKRNDNLRRVSGAWRIARREIFLDQNVLLAKNLPAFF